MCTFIRRETSQPSRVLAVTALHGQLDELSRLLNGLSSYLQSEQLLNAGSEWVVIVSLSLSLY